MEWGNSGRRLAEVGERVRVGCAGVAKLADLESRLKKAEEALAEARAAKKPAPAAAGAACRGVRG